MFIVWTSIYTADDGAPSRNHDNARGLAIADDGTIGVLGERWLEGVSDNEFVVRKLAP